MSTAPRSLLVLGVGFALFLVVALLYSSGAPGPRLTVTYLGRTEDYWGRPIARFAITNIGVATAVSFAGGLVEVLGQTNKVDVACRVNLHRLLPKHGDVVEAILPDGFRGSPWRFTCLYAHQGLRSRIFDWQWAAGGPGTNANWFIPPFLKGVPLDVNATSDWIGK